ncbi:MAG: hypothetical protein ACKVQS_04980 [Fimbriimonadaceae bacterium]
MIAGILILGIVGGLPSPMVNGHSHNDYLQTRPLWAALEAGMCSIEADVFLIDGELRVGHDLEAAKKGPSLYLAYILPLVELEKVGGRLGKGWPEVTLLVDIKADGDAVFSVLGQIVSQFPGTFSTDEDVRAVRIVVSGDRPVAQILGNRTGWLALDGRRDDLGKGISVRRMPLVSEDWGWVGYNRNVDLPALNFDKAKGFADSIRAEGRKSRFWGVPDRADFWGLMEKIGVDWLNTDRPAALREWVLKK